MKNLLFLLITLFLYQCSDTTKYEDEIKAKYDIWKVESDGYKYSCELILKERADESELREIAYYIQSQHSMYKTIFIGYYLKELGITEVYWATTHFTPNLEVKINSFIEHQ